MSHKQGHVHHEYPKWKHHATKESCVVNSADEEKALGAGWVSSKAALAPGAGIVLTDADQGVGQAEVPPEAPVEKPKKPRVSKPKKPAAPAAAV